MLMARMSRDIIVVYNLDYYNVYHYRSSRNNSYIYSCVILCQIIGILVI